MRIILMFAAVLIATPTFADEASIKLKPGPGMETTASYCAACHSLDYPPMNSPFLDAKGWSGVVDKMIKTFGAPIGEAEANEIKAYLTATYGRKP